MLEEEGVPDGEGEYEASSQEEESHWAQGVGARERLRRVCECAEVETEMSSTKRGRERNASDYYVTPVDQIVTFLKAFLELAPKALKGEILDPCAGGDKNHPMSYPVAIFSVDPAAGESGGENGLMWGVDKREDSLAGVRGDYLAMKMPRKYDLIITNPPFTIAQEVIKKALKDVMDGGFVAMLLRLNFFGSKARKPFWEKNMPKYAFVHHERMCFTNDGKTGSIEYMHAVWQKGFHPGHTELRVI